MAGRYEYNEGSAVQVAVAFYDDQDESFVPASARYRVDSLTSRENVVGWTAITAAATATITISGTLNTISAGYVRETRQIIVETTDDDGNKMVDTINYQLLNLLGIS